MARTQTMVQLNQRLLDLLDRRAARMGASRSQIIRDAIEAYLANDRQAVLDREIAEGYTRVPQAGEHDADDWGDLDAQMAALTVAQQRRLRDEEREAGFEPW